MGASIWALFRWSVRLWFITAAVIVIAVISFLAVPLTLDADAQPEANASRHCMSCHQKILESHDRLGSGDAACLVCHDGNDMKMLHLADGTRLPLADSPQLCGQCHHERYGAWKEGTHGIAGTVAVMKCTGCHDPHQPEIAFSNITRPHPAPTPSPPSPSTDLLMILGISLVVVIAAGVVVARRGGGS